MALPIKDTPILSGKDAREFERRMIEDEKQRLSPQEYQWIMRNYRSIRILDSTKNANRSPSGTTD